MKREESPEEMTEAYVDRDDFMYFRLVTFGKRVKKFGPQEANNRPIVVGPSKYSNDQVKIYFVTSK